MPPVPIRPHPFPSGIIAAAAMFLAVSVQADQTTGNDPFREKDPGFFHRASNDVGGFFKRLFGTDEEKQPPQQPPSSKKHRSTGQRYNLDQPPAEVRSTPAASTHAAPSSAAATKPKDAADSNTKPKSPARPPSRGTTLVEDPPKSKSKTQKSPSSDSSSPVVSTETASHAKTKKQTDAAAGSTGAGNVLYSNDATANATQPEPPAKTRTEPAPTPPKPRSEPPSVLTGSKTGKVGRVKSPYAPFSELDVTGLPSGSLALDPTTQKVFRIP